MAVNMDCLTCKFGAIFSILFQILRKARVLLIHLPQSGEHFRETIIVVLRNMPLPGSNEFLCFIAVRAFFFFEPMLRNEKK